MSKTISDMIVQIKHDAALNNLELPSLPEIIVLIQEALDNPDMGINQVAKIIQLDPTLTARLLMIANSPLYRANLQLTDLKQVIQRLGLGVTKNIVNCLIIHNIFNVSSTRLHNRIRALWRHSCRVAAISKVMASVTPGIQPERAMLAGLLHGIGALPILVYADKLDNAQCDPEKLDQAIEQLQASLGQKIIERWKLGDDISVVPLAIDNWQREHDGADYADVVQIAHIHSQFGQRDAQRVPPLNQLPAFNRLSLSKMGPHAGIELIEQASDDINATIRLLNG